MTYIVSGGALNSTQSLDQLAFNCAESAVESQPTCHTTSALFRQRMHLLFISQLSTSFRFLCLPHYLHIFDFVFIVLS